MPAGLRAWERAATKPWDRTGTGTARCWRSGQGAAAVCGDNDHRRRQWTQAMGAGTQTPRQTGGRWREARLQAADSTRALVACIASSNSNSRRGRSCSCWAPSESVASRFMPRLAAGSTASPKHGLYAYISTSPPRHLFIAVSASPVRAMSLVAGPGRGGMRGVPAEMCLFVERHVSYIQSLDTVRPPTRLYISHPLHLRAPQGNQDPRTDT